MLFFKEPGLHEKSLRGLSKAMAHIGASFRFSCSLESGQNGFALSPKPGTVPGLNWL